MSREVIRPKSLTSLAGELPADALRGISKDIERLRKKYPPHPWRMQLNMKSRNFKRN